MEVALQSAPLLYAGVFLLGALVGSFLNVVILRLPPLLEFEWRCQCHELLGVDTDGAIRPPGVMLGRSRCPNCGHTIRPWENIPLISYITLGGRCAGCKAPISRRYPLVECITAVLFVVTIWHFGPNMQGLSALLLTTYLVVLAGIDIDHQLLPDNLTLPLLWAGILLSLWSVHTDLVSSVTGAVAGYLALWSVYHIFRLVTGKEGMGYGDFKLLAALGAWMGWQALPAIILISSIVGATVGLVLISTGKLHRETPMPFGPYIAAAGWITLIWGEQIIALYDGSRAFG